MKTNITVTAPSFLNPFLDRPSQRAFSYVVARFKTLLTSIVGGAGISRRQSELGHELTAIEYATDYAIARFSLASVSAADTVSLNGAAMTATAGTPSGDQFKVGVSNAADARSFVTGLNGSATALLAQHFLAACRQVIITFASIQTGVDFVQLGSTVLHARTQPTDLTAGGVRDTTAPDEVFSLSTSDTNSAISFCNCVNSHPKLKEKFYAANASAVVTVYERPPEAPTGPTVATSDGTRLAITSSLLALADGATVLVQSREPGNAGNSKTIATSNGTRLPITGSVARLAGGAQTVVTI